MDESGPMLEERQEKAPRDVYGGRMLEKKGKGFTRTIFVLACDACGLRIGEGDRLRVCNKRDCRAKICEDCSIGYEGQIYCRRCLKSKLGIEESDLNVLQAIVESQRIGLAQIAHKLEVSSQEIRKSLQRLKKANLVSRRSASIFTQFEPTTVAVCNRLALAKLFTQTDQSEDV